MSTFNAQEICNCMRHLNCMNEPDFNKVFDDPDSYFWHKFEDEYKGNIANFLMYLDLDRQRQLFDYLRRYLDEE